MQPNPPIVSLRHVVFHHGDAFTLRIPALTFQPGERVALVGASGSGKTTLSHLIAGILTPSEGSITVAGETLNALKDRARRRFRATHIGFIFQRFELLDYLSVVENVLLPFRIAPSTPMHEARSRAEDLLRDAGLSAALHRKPNALSQGERQRVALCRALITQPQLLIADEPTGNLDPKTTGTVMDLVFASLTPEQTFLMITHDTSLHPRFSRVLDMAEFEATS